MKYISHNHYRVSDAEAGRLVKASGAKLPRHGYAITVVLDDGRYAELLRTPYQHYTDAPKRGWVWAVMPSDKRVAVEDKRWESGWTRAIK